MVRIETRPSAPQSVCAPVAVAPAVQAYALGRWEVAVLPTLVPIAGLSAPVPNMSMFGVGVLSERTVATHNDKGSAKGEGIALSIIEDPTVSALRDQEVQAVKVVKVHGGDARGIPPRGSPV